VSTIGTRGGQKPNGSGASPFGYSGSSSFGHTFIPPATIQWRPSGKPSFAFGFR
jgi:hypothetical protein